MIEIIHIIIISNSCFPCYTFMRTMLSYNKINDLKIGDEKGDFNCDTAIVLKSGTKLKSSKMLFRIYIFLFQVAFNMVSSG